MVGKSPIDTLSKYYDRYVFSLPSIKKLVAIISLQFLFPVTLIYLLFRNFSFIFFMILLYVIIVLNVILFIGKITPLANLKRKLGFITFFNFLFVPSSIFDIILSYFRIIKINLLPLSIQSSYNVSYFIVYFSLRAFSDNIVILLVMTAIVLIIPSLLNQELFSYGPMLLIPFCFGIATILLVETLFNYLNNFGIKLLGVKGIKLYKAFAKFVLGNEKTDLERILRDYLSEEREIEIYGVGFERTHDNSIKCILIAPAIHPGPFRDLGSSDLPSIFSKIFEKHGINVATFHRASSHEYDIVDSQELDNAIKEFFSYATRSKKYVRITLPFINKIQDFLIISNILNGTILSFVSRLTKGLEDIKNEVERYVERLLHPYKVVIIDAHSSLDMKGENPSPCIGSNEAKIITESITTSLRLLNDSERFDTVDVGFYKMKIGEDCRKGFGGDGITCIILRFKNKVQLMLLLYDANNMLLNVRNKIMKKLMQEYDNFIIMILTTDNHKISGVIPKVRYYPLGVNIEFNELLFLTKQVINKAVNNIEPCRIFTARFTKKMHVLGRDGLNKICTFTNKSAESIEKVFELLLLIYLASVLVLIFL